MAPTQTATRDQLKDAFQVFNQVSEQLVGSYQQLQKQVVQLNHELAAARSERMRELAEKERLANRLTRLLDTLSAAVVVLDAEGRIQEYNPVAETLLSGIKLGCSWDRLQEQHFQPISQSGEYGLNCGRSVTLIRRSLDPEPGSILLMVDVTENRQLRDRVERQERLSAMGEMAAQLAHQLRTPLASVLLYANHLGSDELTASQRLRFSSHSRERLQFMARQIDDMLAFAKGVDIEHRSIHPHQLAKQLEHSVAPLVEANGAQFTLIDELPVDAWICGCMDALLGSMSNLINNSLELGGNGTRIKVSLLAAGGWIEFRFDDNGPGIADQQMARIFDPFYTTRSGGTGLGLAVVQSVVLAHGGTIKVQHSPMGGACFVLNLPMAASGEGGADHDCPLFDGEELRSNL
ncbi:MAG: histidine kinase [Gammaproteobacteria bacterium]|nr:histidine kinase [Gammaproteobacteria bacterium]